METQKINTLTPKFEKHNHSLDILKRNEQTRK